MLIYMLFLTAAAISNPYAYSKLYRNPKFKNAGKYMALPDFLLLVSNASSVSGVLIIVEVKLTLHHLFRTIPISITNKLQLAKVPS